MGDKDRIATTGFSKMSDRQAAIWETGSLANVKTLTIDQTSGVLMPFWTDNNILFLAGKGCVPPQRAARTTLTRRGFAVTGTSATTSTRMTTCSRSRSTSRPTLSAACASFPVAASPSPTARSRVLTRSPRRRSRPLPSSSPEKYAHAILTRYPLTLTHSLAVRLLPIRHLSARAVRRARTQRC